MARKKKEAAEIPEVPVAEIQPPKKRVRKKKAAPLPACWEVCSKLVAKDGIDYVHICLGDTFVTLEELTRMMNCESNPKENVKQ